MAALWSCTIVLVGGFAFSTAVIVRGHRLNLERFSSAMGLFYEKSVSCDELAKYLYFPLVQRAFSALNWTEGPFGDTRVILCNLVSGRWAQSAAIFYNAIPSLPDFELVPNRSMRELIVPAPSNTLAFEHTAVTDEPFEEQYEIQADDTETGVLSRLACAGLPEPCADNAARHNVHEQRMADAARFLVANVPDRRAAVSRRPIALNQQPRQYSAASSDVHSLTRMISRDLHQLGRLTFTVRPFLPQ